MENWVEWYEQPYAEDDSKLNDFIEDIVRRVSWRLFENQESIVEMANETEEGIPRLKEGAIHKIHSVVKSEFGWVAEYITNRILVGYLKSNILPSEEVKYWFEDDLPEDDVEKFWAEIDEYIWNDYAQVLGEETTTELWKKWGKAPRN